MTDFLADIKAMEPVPALHCPDPACGRVLYATPPFSDHTFDIRIGFYCLHGPTKRTTRLLVLTVPGMHADEYDNVRPIEVQRILDANFKSCGGLSRLVHFVWRPRSVIEDLAELDE
jgi:hypothetical protein